MVTYEDKMKNKDNEFLYNKCVNQYYYMMRLQLKKEELKDRIDKALEYMKKEKLLPPDYQYDFDDYSWAFNDIASILRGEDIERL